MTVSNSTDFSSSAAQLIEDARALLGVHADEEPMQAYELERGLRFMTRMLKSWETDGIGSWILTEGTLNLVQGQASYLFGSGGDFTAVPFEITQIRIYRGSVDLEMSQMSREEYFAQPVKTIQGYPVQWYYDRQRDNGTLYLWPVPDATTSTLRFTYRRRIMDVDAGSDLIDLPPEWEEAITFNLASRLTSVYGKAGSAEADKVERGAAASYAVLKNGDAALGVTSLIVTPSAYQRR